MPTPTLIEAAAAIGAPSTDPKVSASLDEAIEAITDQLGAGCYDTTSSPATLARVTLEVAKGLYHRHDDQARTPDINGRPAPGRGVRDDPLAGVWPTIRRLAEQEPGTA